MKQIIVVHGGTTFSSYDRYINYLRTKSVTIDRLAYTPKWKENLSAQLGDEYQILLPTMPNATNAQYSEWKLWFDRVCEVVRDDCILIGHSLGAIFLAKYLSEAPFPKKIAATILIAAPFNDETAEDLTDFKLAHLSSTFTEHAGRVIFFYGNDDPVIPTSEIDRYKRELPSAEYNLLSAPDHFVRTEFPELIATLRSL